MPSSSDETQISKPLHVSSLTESTNSHEPWMLVQYPKNRKSRYPLSLPKSLSPKSPPSLPNPIPKTLPRQAWVEKDSSKTSSSLTDKTLKFFHNPDSNHAPKQNPNAITTIDTTQPPNPNLIIPHCSPTESVVPHSTTPHFTLDTHDLISPCSSLPHPNTSTYDKLLHTPSLPSLASPKTATEIQIHRSLTSKSNAEVPLQPTT